MNRTLLYINPVSLYKADNTLETDKTILTKFKDVKVNISKMIWRVPMVKVSGREKITILKITNSYKPITCAFRTWELCEYPFLPKSTTHSWKVKTSNKLEKPRCHNRLSK